MGRLEVVAPGDAAHLVEGAWRPEDAPRVVACRLDPSLEPPGAVVVRVALVDAVTRPAAMASQDHPAEVLMAEPPAVPWAGVVHQPLAAPRQLPGNQVDEAAYQAATPRVERVHLEDAASQEGACRDGLASRPAASLVEAEPRAEAADAHLAAAREGAYPDRPLDAAERESIVEGDPLRPHLEAHWPAEHWEARVVRERQPRGRPAPESVWRQRAVGQKPPSPPLPQRPWPTRPASHRIDCRVDRSAKPLSALRSLCRSPAVRSASQEVP